MFHVEHRALVIARRVGPDRSVNEPPSNGVPSSQPAQEDKGANMFHVKHAFGHSQEWLAVL